VRAALGVGAGARLAVVYLNPHFRDPRLAGALERALDGFVQHRVGEGYARRPGWLACDPRLADAVAAADVLISAAGTGALAQARLFGTPLVALATDQPEQAGNLAELAGRLPHLRRVEAGTGDSALAARVRAAVAELALAPDAALGRPDPTARVAALHAAWTDRFVRLVDLSTEETECSALRWS
jgi:hypothetical protein